MHIITINEIASVQQMEQREDYKQINFPWETW